MTFEPRPARFGAQGFGGGAPEMASCSPKSDFYFLIMARKFFFKFFTMEMLYLGAHPLGGRAHGTWVRAAAPAGLGG